MPPIVSLFLQKIYRPQGVRFCFGVTCGHIARDKSAHARRVVARCNKFQHEPKLSKVLAARHSRSPLASAPCACASGHVCGASTSGHLRGHTGRKSTVLVASPHVASFQPVEQTKFQPPREFPKSSSHLCSARRSLVVDLSDLVRQLVALFHRFAKRIRRSWRGTSSACLHGFGLFGLAVDRPAMKPCSWSLSSLEKMFNVRSILKFRVPASQSDTEVGEHFTKLELRALLAVSFGKHDPRKISTTDGSMPWTAASASAIFRGDDQAASACRSSRR